MHIDRGYLTPSVHVHPSLLLVQVSDERVSWLKANQQSIRRSYFIALLTVADGTVWRARGSCRGIGAAKQKRQFMFLQQTFNDQFALGRRPLPLQNAAGQK